MFQVEEKPDVTYSDIGGCKEQIEKLREVVEMPLLHVSIFVAITDVPRSYFDCLIRCVCSCSSCVTNWLGNVEAK